MIKNRKTDLSQIKIDKIRSFLFKEAEKDIANELDGNKKEEEQGGVQEELFVQSMFKENEDNYIEDIEGRKLNQQLEQKIRKETEEIKKIIRDGQKKLYGKNEVEALAENLIHGTDNTKEFNTKNLEILGDHSPAEEESE